ncbi:MAG: MMPL family transporter [Sandaracinus sp.]
MEPLIQGIVRRRVIVVLSLVALTAAMATAIPSLRARFAPEDLVAPDEAARADAERIARELGSDQTPLLVVLEAAPDGRTTDVAHLVFLHRVARALAADAHVDHVEGPTTTPLPFTEAIDTGDDATLDTLGDESAPDLGTPEEQEAIASIVAADPGRFPLGLMSLAERGLERIVIAPLVPADVDPTEADAARLEERLAAEPTLRRRLVSDDRRVAILAVMPRADLSDGASDELVRRARAIVAREEAPEGARVSLSGLPYLRVVMLEALHADQLLLVLLALAGSLVVLVLGMRSVAGVLLPLGTVGITVVLTVGGMALAGVPLDLLTNMIPPLLVTIGLAEAVHMVLRYEEELPLAKGDREEAAIVTLRHTWLACFVTTFTTAIGFGALAVSDTEALRRFGVVAGLASMLAYGVTVLFVPALLPTHRAPKRAVADRAPDLLDRAIDALARGASARPQAVLAVSALLFVGSLALARGLVVDSALLDQFALGSDVARVTHLLESELDGVRRLTVEVREDAPAAHPFHTAAGLEALRSMSARIAAEEGVLRVGTVSDLALSARALVDQDDASRAEPFHSDAEVEGLFALLAADGRELDHLVASDGSAARIEVCLEDRGAARILSMIDRIRSDASAHGLRVAFAGEAYDASRGLDRILRSLGSFTGAIVLIFVVMTLLFRSVRLGLLSLPPNLLPLAMTLAYMVVRGIPLHAATVIVFTVTAGLLVDGATHVIARFREEQERGGDAHDVMVRTMQTSGRGVVLSSLTLLLGYGALLFSRFEPVRLFGELSGVAIGLALLAQLVLLPMMLARWAMPRREARPTPNPDAERAPIAASEP